MGENIIPQILYVEDEEFNAHIMKTLLKGYFTVDVAYDVETADNKITTNDYKAIIVDINLGEKISGIDFASNLRNDSRFSNIPIIGITANFTMQHNRLIAVKVFNDLLIKPVSKITLFKVLSQLLPEYAII